MPPYLKLTEEIAADIKARVKTLDFKTIEKVRKDKQENGTFDVIISTEDIDRSGEIVRQNGWELANYKNNPIVLWGHDYYSLPIGVCTETYITEKNGVPALGARGVFYPADINPFAQQVRRMYDYGIKAGLGVGCTTSVGFIPKEFDESNRAVITKAELLEFSFVPIPANQGVGPAQGRAFTFEEAKELKLDQVVLAKKGIQFTEKAACKGLGVCEDGECDHNKKEAQAGDTCTTDDGSPGVLTTDPKDPDGALVCLPQDEDKSVKAEEPGKTRLLASVNDEHERHSDEVAKCFDSFQKAVAEDRGEPEANEDEGKKAKRLSDDARAMRTNLKDLRSSLADEHLMHRSKSIADFRSFEPSDKAFDKNEHLKALRDEHDAYETKCNKSLDTFDEKCMKSVQGEPGEVDGHTDWITGKMETSQNVHKKSVTKIAKAMCKSAYGEEDEADEKTLDILKEFLAPHINANLLPAVAGKIGARLAAENKVKTAEVYTYLKAATAVLEVLHKDLADGNEEESRSDVTPKGNGDGSRENRSRTRSTSRSEDPALKAHLRAREIVGGIEAAARDALGKINADIRERSRT
jgi:hypothetical protein